MPVKKIYFSNLKGVRLSGRLELPLMKKPLAYAIFAHAFTGSKNLSASRHISRSFRLNGIAVLRFDFTGLGDSEGTFEETNFSTNVDDIIAAAAYLEKNYEAPKIVVGHSLGGAASLFAGVRLPTIKAIATVGTPSEPEHVIHLLESELETIEIQGKADVTIGGQLHTIKKQFLEDLRTKDMCSIVADMDKALLVLHSPQDKIVEIENAAKIYHAAMHPKSFVTLNQADHMLTNKDDAYYVGNVISSWVKRYLDLPKEEKLSTHKQVVAKLDNEDYTTEVMAGRHGLLVDESERIGGNDFGPSPYELLCASLASSTAMTIQMYANKESIEIEEVKVHLSHNRSYSDDCLVRQQGDDFRIKYFEREIEIYGNVTSEQLDGLFVVAQHCPVYRMLSVSIKIETTIEKVFHNMLTDDT